jgi:hypothetical protein
VYFERKIQLLEFFCISGRLFVTIDSDKWNSTALECGIIAEVGEDDSPLVGFYKNFTRWKNFVKRCEFLLDGTVVCSDEGFFYVEAICQTIAKIIYRTMN